MFFIPQLFERCQDVVRATDWVQLMHLCDYEIAWARVFMLDFDRAVPLWSKLQAENAWSKAFYCYQAAACLLALDRLDDARAKFKEVEKLITRKIAGVLICCIAPDR